MSSLSDNAGRSPPPGASTAMARPALWRRLGDGWVGSVVITVLAVAALMALWEGLAIYFQVPLWLLPKPSDFLYRFFADYALLWRHASATLTTLSAGFAIGVAIAVPLGLLIVSVPALERGLFPVIVFLNIMPKTIIGPILIVWFGIGPLVSVIIVFLMAFFPVLVDAMAGFRAIDPRLRYITRSMGATRAQTLRHIRLPAALAHIFAGMKIGIVKAVEGVIIAEFIASSAGLGFLIMRAAGFMDMTLMFSAFLATALLALVVNGALGMVEALTMPWARHKRG